MIVYTVDYRLADGQQLNPRYPRGGGGWYPWELLLGVYRPVLQTLTRFQTKKCNYPYPFSDLAFWQKLCYHYLAVRAQTQKFFQSISNSHISLSLTHCELKRQKMFIHSRSSLENPTRFQIKIDSVYLISDQNGTKTLPSGGAYLYGLYKVVPSPPPGPGKNKSLTNI